MTSAPDTVVPHYTLKEAVARFFPDGHVTVSSLRTEIRKGRLRVTEVAGKFLVTEKAIADMLESCRQCRAQGSPRASTSAVPGTDAVPSGSSGTERLKSAQAALKEILKGQKKPSAGTSRANTNPPVPFPRPSSTSMK